MKKSSRLLLTISILFFSMPLLTLSAEETMQAPIIDAPELEEVYDAGTYPVNIIYIDANGNEVVETINVTLKSKRTGEKDEELIDAHDLEIKKGVFGKIQDSQLIELTNARAWNKKTNEKIPITSVEKKTTNQSFGMYEVTFSTKNNTSTTVKIIEVEEAYLTNLNKYYDFGETNLQYTGTVISISFFVLLPFLLFFLGFRRVDKELDEIDAILYKRNK